MKRRAQGLVVWLLLLPLAAIAFLAAPVVILLAKDEAHAKNALRAVDELPSAVLFGGSAYMSLSAWSWACRERWWARVVICVTDRIQHGHTAQAYLDEAPLLELIQARKEGRI